MEELERIMSRFNITKKVLLIESWHEHRGLERMIFPHTYVQAGTFFSAKFRKGSSKKVKN